MHRKGNKISKLLICNTRYIIIKKPWDFHFKNVLNFRRGFDLLFRGAQVINPIMRS